MTKVSSSISETKYTGFDILGRVLSSQQITDGQTYGSSYTYDLSGALIEQTYPSGRVVKNVLDNNGDLSIVQSKRTSNHGFWNYARHFTFNAAGAVTSLQLGNNRWESTTFNSRLQPTQIALGTVQNGTDKLDLEFGYGATANNGNVLSQTITVPTAGSHTGFTATQTYTYDSLNRIKDATENITAQTPPTWKQTFIYDRYGNRNFDQANTTQPASFADPNVTNPTISATNNRFSPGQGYSYDSSGNTTQDALGRTFVYDAENKQIAVIENSVTIGEYFYDGDGKRIKKIVPNTGEVTIFVYDAAGKLIQEHSTTVASPSEAKISYLTNDHLGSPRITTDQYGQVISRRDFHPFGEEIFRAGYGSDSVRQKFTGYERDNETELDFAQARYYNKNHGRFTSVDPENAGAMEDYPQSWNGYAYGGNNPILFVDPDGREYLLCDKDRKNCVTQTDEIVKGAQRNIRGSFQETDRVGHFDMGNVLDGDGNVIGTYERISIDREYQFVYGVAEHSIRKAKVVGVLAGAAVVTGACIALCGPAAAVAAPFVLKTAFGLIKYGGKNLKIRPDVVSKGGRSGQNVKNLASEANSVVKGSKQGRVYVTDQNGKVILDITRDRVKEVGTRGFVKGSERRPTAEEIQLIKTIWK